MTSRGAIAESTPHILHIRPEALAKFLMEIPTLEGALTSSDFPEGTIIYSGAFVAITPHSHNIRPEAFAKSCANTTWHLVECLV